MSLRGILFGPPIASSEGKKEQLTVFTGVPVLGLDALASTGYGPEAALTILAPLGLIGLRYYPIIVLAIVVELLLLYLSYRQTAAAYPDGGGAYIVAKDNFGIQAGLWAAVALLLDYLLNVSVAIAAGIAAVVSLIPALQPHALLLCLIVLLMLTFLNLRGIRQSGLVFLAPVAVFIGCIGVTIAIGLIRAWQSGGQPHPVVPPPAIPQTAAAMSTWLLLGAFANGCTAMTGVEAVSNGVPLFREPKVFNATRTLTAIILVLTLFLLGLAYLCPAYRIGAMNEQQAGYQTILSQLVAAVAGRGVFYYVSLVSIFIVLTYSAQTSFADFPRVCRLLAEDGFLPPGFAIRGRRLVFSHGIVVLAILSAVLLIVFRGVTQKLIPLFAVGAFSAFVFSQVGMVKHWLRKGGPGSRIKLIFNGVGALATSAALVIIILAKFTEGAWVTVLLALALVVLLRQISKHYNRIRREVEQPLELKPRELHPLVVVIPIDGWNRVAEKAVRFGLHLSDDITAVHISTEQDNKKHLRELWTEKVEKPARAANSTVPRLEIIDSPYRQIYQPILDVINKIKKQNPDRLVAVIIPELVEPHWYDYLLHNMYGAGLKTLLYLRGDERTIVINTPWYLRDV
ncbi:MAG TPA: APC family permease [Terriglobales bacterium]